MIDPAVIEAQLRAKAREFLDLSAHLAELVSADPRVAELRRTASDALAKGDFDAADEALADAERLDRGRVEEQPDQLETLLTSAAESRAVRAAAARLRADIRPAEHFGDAARTWRRRSATLSRRRQTWRITAESVATTKRCGPRSHAIGLSVIKRPASIRRLGHDPEQSRQRALPRERESGTARLEEAVAAYRAALEEWTRSACRWTGP